MAELALIKTCGQGVPQREIRTHVYLNVCHPIFMEDLIRRIILEPSFMLDIGQKLKKRLLVMDVYVVSAVMTGSELPESQPGNLDLFKVAWEAWGGREGGRRRRERGDGRIFLWHL